MSLTEVLNTDVNDASESDMVEAKYVLLPEGNLFRIKALRDIDGVCEEGELGGLVEHPWNLSHEGNCWVLDEARVLGQARVFDNAIIADKAIVQHKAKVFGNAVVRGEALVEQWAVVYDDAIVKDKVTLSANSRTYGTTLRYGSYIKSKAQKFY